MAVQTQIQTRRGAAATWTSTNPTLAAGEIGFESDTNKFKIGTGSTAWVSLPYASNVSPLTTKGDLYGFSTTNARLAVGANGETLVADSSATTGLRYREDYAAGKNKIINGAFDNWQRGTTFTFSGTGGYTADRFQITSGSGGVVTVTQGAFTPGSAPLAGVESQYFLNLNYTTSGTSAADNGQHIEDVRTFAGQTVTVSVYAKVSSGTHSITPQLVQRFGSGGSGAGATSGTTFTATTTFQRFTATINVPSVSGKTIGAGSSLQFRLDLGTTGVKQFQFWGFQVEAGSVATAFQTATGTLAGELAACQRYYYRLTVPALSNGFGVGLVDTTTTGLIKTTYPVTMRTSPTALEQNGTAGDYGLRTSGGTITVNSAVPAFSNANTNEALTTFTVASGLTAGQSVLGRIIVANAFLGWSAEL